MKKTKFSGFSGRFNLCLICFLIGIFVAEVYRVLSGVASFSAFAIHGMPWFAFIALYVLVAEIVCTKHLVLWKFHCRYWYAAMILFYVPLILFADDWNWGMFLFAGVFMLRILAPYERLHRLSEEVFVE
ncbi:MAG: hypothetical protein J6C85_01450 [Alphaproteobacteria bacterium]|nr:hypothetical protein [Alphaproteobacteria bacterium]